MTSDRLSLELELFELPPPLSFGRQLLGILRRWCDSAGRQDPLAQLSPQLLRDIGISETDVWRETRQPPWLG